MATFFKFKDQVSINLDNVTFIKVDELPIDGKYAIRFHSVDGFEKHFECNSREEAFELEEKILNLYGNSYK